jgi:hypothetical protein
MTANVRFGLGPEGHEAMYIATVTDDGQRGFEGYCDGRRAPHTV